MEWNNRHRLMGLNLDISPEDLERLLTFIAIRGKAILADFHGPMPLFRFSAKLSEATGTRLPLGPLGLGSLSDSVKTLLRMLNDPGLRLLAPSDAPGVGYIYDEQNSQTWPVVA